MLNLESKKQLLVYLKQGHVATVQFTSYFDKNKIHTAYVSKPANLENQDPESQRVVFFREDKNCFEDVEWRTIKQWTPGGKFGSTHSAATAMPKHADTTI